MTRTIDYRDITASESPLTFEGAMVNRYDGKGEVPMKEQLCDAGCGRPGVVEKVGDGWHSWWCDDSGGRCSPRIYPAPTDERVTRYAAALLRALHACYRHDAVKERHEVDKGIICNRCGWTPELEAELRSVVGETR